jgi:hypothetical protein
VFFAYTAFEEFSLSFPLMPDGGSVFDSEITGCFRISRLSIAGLDRRLVG